jgi:hypothetical protein
MIRPGIDSLGRPAVCADNHYDAVSTPPKHRGSYGLLSVIVPKDLHAAGVRQRAYMALALTLILRTIRSQGNALKTGANHHLA